nr:MAG TPA: hypothetical protein [Caudoviricetes sp.]
MVLQYSLYKLCGIIELRIQEQIMEISHKSSCCFSRS